MTGSVPVARRCTPLEIDGAEFVRALKAHDDTAWAQLYDRHHTAIWRYALAKTGVRESADDVASQVFVEALESIHRFQLRGKPVLAWLYTIARNHAAKSVRGRHRESRPVDPDRLHASTDEAFETVALSQALDRLTRLQREIIALRYYAGYSTAEIAVLLRRNDAAVYSAEARAIAALRLHFSGESKKLPTRPDEFRGVSGIGGLEGR